MATTIFFNGLLTAIPGSYVKIDASGLESQGLTSAGIVGVIGTAEGGEPVSITDSDPLTPLMEEAEDFHVFNKPEASRSVFRSGNLREAIPLLFEPAKDPDIPGGAAQVVAMKVNPAKQSTATFANAQGDAIDVTSADWGAFTEQINISIADGDSQGKLLTITFEDVIETVDDLGGDAIFTLSYVDGTDGWDAMTAQVLTGGLIECLGSRDELGIDTPITHPTPGILEVVSSDAGDTTQEVEIWGLTGASAILYDKVTLTGVGAVDFTGTFTKVLAVRLSAVAAGTVTVQADGGGAAVCAIAPASLTAGMQEGVAMFVNGGKVTVVSSGASVKEIIIEGTSATGATQRETITLTGTSPVVGTLDFSTVTVLALGDVEAAQTLTFSAEAAKTVAAVHTTLQKVADYFNAKVVGANGFVLDMVTALTLFDPANLDVMAAAADILDLTPDFLADNWTIVDWINTNSQLITAAAASGASGGAPTNTTVPVFLSGGEEGAAAAAHWLLALNLLKKRRVNTVVVLTATPSVHADLDAHCAYMGGLGANERDGVVGLMNAGLTGLPTKTEVKAQIVNLNSRHIRAVPQSVERYNTAGEREEMDPPFAACVVAGMQAGSPVGTPLTWKYANALGFKQDSSWNPVDDSNEMIQAGACFFENVDGVGRRMVRNVTTHRSTNNLAFTEGSVNEAVNYSAYNFRTAMQVVVGKKGFSGTLAAGHSNATNILGLLVDEGVLVLYRALSIELVVDVMEVSAELAPVIPVNFVTTVLHLVVVQQSA